MASHHPTVDPILAELKEALADVKPLTPRIPLISTVSQDGGAATFDADYWVVNLRNPVRFSQAVATAAEKHASFVEVSPHPLLSHAINGTLDSAKPRGGAQVVGTLTRDNPETLTFHTQLATVRPPSIAAKHNAGGAKKMIDLPPTPWQHVRYWAAPFSATRQAASAHPLLGIHVEMPSGRDHVFTADVGTELLPWMLDHKVHGQPVMPGTGFGEIALAAASEALGVPAQSVTVGVEVEQMLPLGETTQLTTQLTRGEKDGDEIRVEIHSRSATGAWIRHAVAKIEVGQSDPPTVPAASVGPRHGGFACGSVLRVARHRSASRARVRRADPYRPQGRRYLGNRDRPARRGDRAPRLPNPSGTARRGIAGPGRRAVQRFVGRLQARRPICRCRSRRSGCSAKSGDAPDAAPSWSTPRVTVPASWAAF